MDDFFNTNLSHEQLFFEDNLSPSNVGFFPGGLRSGENPSLYQMDPTHYNDAIMRQAVAHVNAGTYNLAANNCQTYGSKLRAEYSRLTSSPVSASPQ